MFVFQEYSWLDFIINFGQVVYALNILNQHKGKGSVKSLQRKAMMPFNFMKDLLGKTFHP
jgi:hypothetical protein